MTNKYKENNNQNWVAKDKTTSGQKLTVDA